MAIKIDPNKMIYIVKIKQKDRQGWLTGNYEDDVNKQSKYAYQFGNMQDALKWVGHWIKEQYEEVLDVHIYESKPVY
jgi:hypothetical protein